jgi:tRNA A-37 threonylcarbamoyl transferase component Bud32
VTVSARGEVVVERRAGTTCRYLRAFRTEALQSFLANPEIPFERGSMLKTGNTSTVARVAIGGHRFIVKRYNVKNFAHRLRLSLKRRSRGRNAWRFGQVLYHAGVPTARPVALLERRRGLLRDTAFLVMQDLDAADLRQALRQSEAAGLQTAWIRAVTEVFLELTRLRLCHGDTKATNFLAVGDRVALIDLDSMGADRRGRGIADDVRRFLANWRDCPAIQQAFAEAFRDAGLAGA